MKFADRVGHEASEGPLAMMLSVVGVAGLVAIALVVTAPDAEDAMRAVRAEQAADTVVCTQREVQATIREYQDRQWAAERERDEMRDLAHQYRNLLYRHGIWRVPAGRLGS